MEDERFPANSRASRQKLPQKDEKKVERVTTGNVVQRKKPLGRRFVETFAGGDAKGVGYYVLFDVLIPAFKDMIVDAGQEALRRLILGESRGSHRASRSGSGYTAYNRYTSSAPWKREREDPREFSRRARSAHDFDEIILASRPEADEVLERLYDLVSQYGEAAVSDLYELVGIAPSFTDHKWGWREIPGAGVVRVRDGYLLDLPRPKPLD